jgi:hypothetical protein
MALQKNRAAWGERARNFVGSQERILTHTLPPASSASFSADLSLTKRNLFVTCLIALSYRVFTIERDPN